ncbi:hypothetical protein P0082_11170 [Candidatus Haliotispira prima]|uniref:Alpha/beta hydrolase n=1 Tax=Candidatus Haliotispira prima TaxID=3034016 RepID=A0ABY8MGA5_9SPIO|nr:hypothetical protein P0082_11170 [Candidatus Haliotispira prima]
MQKIASLFFATFILGSCVGQKSILEELNKTIAVNNKEQCDQKDGYWYNGKCWANFKEFDNGIAIADIDKVVDEQLVLAEEFKIMINEKSYPIDSSLIEESEENSILILMNTFTDNEGLKTLLQISDLDESKNGTFSTKAVLVKGNLLEMAEVSSKNLLESSKIEGAFKATLINEEDSHYTFAGSMNNTDTNKTYKVELEVSDVITSIGDTTLEVKGDKAYLNGTLGTKGYAQFRDLIKNHPEVKTIVLQDVPGSMNDAVNMHTGRIIREAGLTTMVEADSVISSGGVDLFCAGKERIVTKGAQLGIHSWGGEGLSADDLPRDHPAHQYQIEYFTMCLGETIGPNFYFRTLSAAPAGEMYWMNDEEIKEKIATQFITQ